MKSKHNPEYRAIDWIIGERLSRHETFIRAIKILWRRISWFVGVFLGLQAVQVVIPLAQLVITKKLVDSLQNKGFSFYPIAVLIVLQFALSLIASGVRGIERLSQIQAQHILSLHIELLIAARTTTIPLAFYDEGRTHDALHRILGSGPQQILGLFTSGISVIRSIVVLISYSVILLQYSVWLAATILVVVLPSLLMNLKVGQWRVHHTWTQTPLARRVSYLGSLLRSREAAKEIRVFNCGPYLTELWENLFLAYGYEKKRLEGRAAGLRFVAEGINALASSAGIGALVWQAFYERLSLGTYVALSQALLTTHLEVQAITSHISTVYVDLVKAGELFAFIDKDFSTHKDHLLPFPEPLRKGISVHNVSYSYPGSPTESLSEVSFHIAAGEKVAIVGANGAGKSTIIKCLLGLYSPTQGRILFDGIDLKSISSNSLRSQMTAVFQDHVRFHLSLRHNLSVACPEAENDDQRLYKAASQGGVDFTASLPRGLDTELGVVFFGGYELSHGQWQKVALSRALLRPAQIVILDEHTASLDPVAEIDVNIRLLESVKGKTTIVVTHRLGICRFVDRILVFANGRLLEEGCHDDLMSRNGEYARLFRSQAEWYGNFVNSREGGSQNWGKEVGQKT